jgi:coproporphyrinogen III oxidase-like Fe-S oxidoreductase
VGAGPGAHGRITEDGVRMATATERNPEVWRKMVEQQGQGLIINESLDTEEVADEFLVMGLRLAEGIDPARYQTLSGRRFDPGRVSDLKTHGLIAERANGRLAVTPEGFPVLNAVVADLAAEPLIEGMSDPLGLALN